MPTLDTKERSDVPQLTFWERKAKALWEVIRATDRLASLPFALIKDVFLKETPQEQAETVDLIARHESGHALMDIFNKEPIVQMYIAKTSLGVQNALGLFAGAVVKEKGSMFGELGLIRSLKNLLGMEQDDLDKEIPKNNEGLVRKVLGFMGGPATEYVFGKKNGDFLDKIKQVDTERPNSDDEYIIYLLKNTLQAQKSDIKREDLDKFAEHIFKKIVEYYEDPIVKECIVIMAEHLKEEAEINEERKGEGINQKLVKRLAEKGVSEAQFSEVSRKYEALVQELTDFLESSLRA